mmetsp:Transcript_15442/g.44218  ORF Transcript_15442/g.44218 Transcript_15442/m.44218 type:complete len:651 (-) Transcript_15442:145-2097(-)
MRVVLLFALLAGHGAGAGQEVDAAGTCAGLASECQEEDQQSAMQLQRAGRGRGNASRGDCDGDGEGDCGTWDFCLNQCHNPAKCKYYPLQGCQCRRCGDQGQAFSDPILQKSSPGTTYYGRWMNWADDIDTCAPWLMPKDDAALGRLLAYARAKGYKVRPGGATHTTGGLVTDGGSTKTLVVSLAEYTAPSDWEFKIDHQSGSKALVRVNAGWNQLQLYAKMRPQGYFLPTQTAGYFFQIAGVVANTVHGSTYREGFSHEGVTAMRVMLADGSVRVVREEEELRYWRNSYGLLGIILGVELKVELRWRFQMYTAQRQLEAWTEEELWEFLRFDASADLPAKVGPCIYGGSGKAEAGEFFANFFEDPPRLLAYVKRANDDADVPGVEDVFPAEGDANYKAMLNELKYSKTHGYATYSNLARREGAPPISLPSVPTINLPLDELLQLLPTSNRSFRVEVAEGLASTSFVGIPKMVASMRSQVNDGFFLTEAPRVFYSAYFLKANDTFKALDILKGIYRRSHKAQRGFLWNQPVEFRFVDVNDDAVLQVREPGRYIVVEAVAFPGTAKDQQEYMRAFYEVQEALKTAFEDAKPHIGKLWGLSETNGRIEAFSSDVACSIYSNAQKRKFNSYRSEVDPEGLFAQGLGAQLLKRC